MKRPFVIAVLLLSALPAMGALRFGLGNAVAKRSAELFDKAAGPVTGDNVAATLSVCPSGAFLDSLPINMSQVRGVDPLGHVQPTGHTFPSDHIYYYASTTTTTAVYAPGNIHITSIGTSSNLSATPTYTDYTISFYACRNFRVVYGHVKTLTASLLTQAGDLNQNCQTYSTGGSTFQGCTAYTNIVMQSGDLIGYIATSAALDFGASDDRVSLHYVSPARRGPYQLHTVCPIDYFTAGPKATMEAKLGRFDGGYTRVTAPICGTIDQDVAGTAKGYWYHPGSPDNPEDPHLSLIDNNVYAPQQTISVGNSLPNTGGQWYIFTAVSGAGQTNREFSEVTADGQIYCYDSFFDPIGQAIGPGGSPIYILQMLSSTTLKFEKISPATTCAAAAPWAFTSNAVTFQR